MRNLSCLFLLLIIAALVNGIQAGRLVSRDPGMKPNAKPPPTCKAGEVVKTESRGSAYSNISSEGVKFSHCCSRHLECYCICDKNISKQVCDEGFRRCLQNACLDGLPNKSNFEKRRCSTGWSWSGPGMVNSQVAESIEFSCKRYEEVQTTCCPN